MEAPASPDARSTVTPVSHSQDFINSRKLNTKGAEAIVGQYPGSTCRELAAYSGKHHSRLASRLPAATRATKKLAVYRGPRRICKVTGNIALTWWNREVPQ